MDNEKSEVAKEILVSLVEAIQTNNELLAKQIELQESTNEVLESLEEGIDALGGLIYKGEQFLTALSDKAVNGEIANPFASSFLSKVNEVLKDINSIVAETEEE